MADFVGLLSPYTIRGTTRKAVVSALRGLIKNHCFIDSLCSVPKFYWSNSTFVTFVSVLDGNVSVRQTAYSLYVTRPVQLNFTAH